MTVKVCAKNLDFWHNVSISYSILGEILERIKIICIRDKKAYYLRINNAFFSATGDYHVNQQRNSSP
jgi:hypothetical protein